MDVSMDEVERLINDPRAIGKLLSALEDERERRRIAEKKLQAMEQEAPLGRRLVKRTTITETIEWQRSLFES